jgi:hypothetical protein
MFFRFRQYFKGKDYFNDRKTIVFYQIYPPAWNSVKPIYEAFLKNPNYNAVILVSPTIEDIKKSNSSCDAYKFFSAIIDKENLIFSYSFSKCKFFDLKTLKPNFVFYNRPYNSEIPDKRLRSSVVASYSSVCFLHYGFSLSNSYSKYWANEDFIYYASHIFSENMTKFEEYNRVLRLHNWAGSVSIHNVGYPRFQLINQIKSKDNSRSVLWIPRWTVDNTNPDSSSFLDMIWPLLEFFENHNKLKLICRPHPKMISNLIKSGLLSISDYNYIKNSISRLNNVSFDENLDYLDSINQADILLADYSALIADFFCTSKPIIYLGNSTHFNNEASNMAQTFYYPNNQKSTFSLILDLSNGQDPMKKKRNELSDIFYKSNYDASSKIVNIIELSGENFEKI